MGTKQCSPGDPLPVPHNTRPIFSTKRSSGGSRPTRCPTQPHCTPALTPQRGRRSSDPREMLHTNTSPRRGGGALVHQEQPRLWGAWVPPLPPEKESAGRRGVFGCVVLVIINISFWHQYHLNYGPAVSRHLLVSSHLDAVAQRTQEEDGMKAKWGMESPAPAGTAWG